MAAAFSKAIRVHVACFVTLSCLLACPSAKPTKPPPAGEPTRPEKTGETELPKVAVETPEVALRERPAPADVSDLEGALKAVRLGNPEGAAKFLSAHVEKHPEDNAARIELARAFAAIGAWGKGVAILGAAPAPDALVLRRRAELLARIGRWSDALKDLEAAAKVAPKDIAVRGDLLTALHHTGKGDEQRAKDLLDSLYDAYEAGDAKSAPDLLAVAQAALLRGSTGAFKDANMVLEEAERLAPVAEGSWDADRILLVRGGMFLDKYAAEEAFTTFGLLLERDPWHTEALVGVARTHVAELQFAAGSRAAEEALLVAPGHPDAHAVLARIALVEGRREEARERVTEKVLAVDSHHRAGRAVLAGLALLEQRAGEYDKHRDEALAGDPAGGGFFADLADILGFLHLYPEADVVLEEGAKVAPRDPAVQSGLGLNRLRLGDEAGGRAALEAAWKQDRFNARTRNTLDLYDQQIDKEYVDAKVGASTLRLPREDAELVRGGLVDAVEASRKDLDKAYGIHAGTLRLEFFADPDAFSIRTIGVPSLGAVAVCFGPVITFIGPYHGTHHIDMVIRHEMAHVYAIRKSKGRVPRWFTEGLSEWESELEDPSWARESAELLMRAARAGKRRKLGELELAFIRAESAEGMEVAYSTAAYAIRWLGNTYGREKLIAVLEGYATGADTDELFRKHLGKSVAELEKDFETWIGGQLEAKISGWMPLPGGKDERHQLLKQAIEQAEANDGPAAIRTLEKLIGKGGDGYVPRMMLAALLLDGPKPGAARRHLEAARKFNLEAVDPLARLADLARKDGDVKEEKARLKDALAIEANAFEPAARLLMLGLVTDDAKAAELAVARAQAIAPLHPITLSGRALILAKGKDKATAQLLLARAEQALSSPEGPGDTFVVAAMAAAALDKKELAKTWAAVARKDERLVAAAARKLDGL